MCTTPSPSRATLWCMDVCFITRHMPLTSTGGAPSSVLLFRSRCRTIRFWASSEQSPQRVRRMQQAYAYAVSFDTGFVECHAVHDETTTYRIIQTREQFENIRSVCSPLVPSGEARFIKRNRSEASSTSTRPFSTQTEAKEASGGIYPSENMLHWNAVSLMGI